MGRAYIGNMGYVFGQGTPRPGSILLVTPEGNARVVAEGLAFPNGMVITPDGQTLIVAESHAARLTAFHLEPDGSLSHRRAWAQFEDRGDYGANYSRWHLSGCRRGGVDRFSQYKGCASGEGRGPDYGSSPAFDHSPCLHVRGLRVPYLVYHNH